MILLCEVTGLFDIVLILMECRFSGERCQPFAKT